MAADNRMEVEEPLVEEEVTKELHKPRVELRKACGKVAEKDIPKDNFCLEKWSLHGDLSVPSPYFHFRSFSSL